MSALAAANGLNMLENMSIPKAGQTIKAPQVNATDFVKDYIVNKLPKHAATFGMSVFGRDDGSGMLTHRVIEAGTNPDFLGGIFNPK